MTIANQNSARHSVGKSYSTNAAVQNVNKAFVYDMDWTASLIIEVLATKLDVNS